MKQIFTIIFILLFGYSFGQNIGINNTGNTPEPSAGLDVDFTNKGFLPPRLNSSQMFGISNPAEGLIVYNTDVGCPHFVNKNGLWQSMCDNNIASLPTADFTTPNFIICENVCIDFTDLSIDNGHAITSWSWSYDGGGTPNTSSVQNPSNICFNTPGVYTISLTVSNIYGSNTKNYQITVNGGCSSCNHTGLALGDVYQGGVIFDITTDINGCQSGKIVSLYKTYNEASLAWSPSSGVTGATSLTDGWANTNTIVGIYGNDVYAAKECRDYNGAGLSDWYLGAENEMITLQAAKTMVNTAISQAGGEQMTGLFFWTSTEYNSTTAMRINFNDGTLNNLTKTLNGTYRTRAIRAFF